MNQLVLKNLHAFDYAYGEAINTLCTNLKFCGDEKRRIMLTSVQAHEGKSLISLSMQRVLAQLGHRVVLVDADLRRSQMVSRYGMKVVNGTGKGLAHYLAGWASADEIIYETSVPNAYMIPVGKIVPNSLSLISSPRIETLFAQLKNQFDYVLIDAPPIGAIIDAAEMSRYCDGTLLIVKYNYTSRTALCDARDQIERAGCEVLGVVLNEVDIDSVSGKKYYNKQYYARYTSDYNKPMRRKIKKNSGKD